MNNKILILLIGSMAYGNHIHGTANHVKSYFSLRPVAVYQKFQEEPVENGQQGRVVQPVQANVSNQGAPQNNAQHNVQPVQAVQQNNQCFTFGQRATAIMHYLFPVTTNNSTFETK